GEGDVGAVVRSNAGARGFAEELREWVRLEATSVANTRVMTVSARDSGHPVENINVSAAVHAVFREVHQQFEVRLEWISSRFLGPAGEEPPAPALGEGTAPTDRAHVEAQLRAGLELPFRPHLVWSEKVSLPIDSVMADTYLGAESWLDWYSS